MNSNPYSKLRFNPASFESAKMDAVNQARNTFDAQMGDALNTGAMAGSVQGVANPTRLGSDSAARIYDKRSQVTSDIITKFDSMKANAASTFDSRKQFLDAEFEASKPNAFDYFSFGANALGAIASPLASLGIFDKFLKLANPDKPAFNIPSPALPTLPKALRTIQQERKEEAERKKAEQDAKEQGEGGGYNSYDINYMQPSNNFYYLKQPFGRRRNIG